MSLSLSSLIFLLSSHFYISSSPFLFISLDLFSLLSSPPLCCCCDVAVCVAVCVAVFCVCLFLFVCVGWLVGWLGWLVGWVGWLVVGWLVLLFGWLEVVVCHGCGCGRGVACARGAGIHGDVLNVHTEEGGERRGEGGCHRQYSAYHKITTGSYIF